MYNKWNIAVQFLGFVGLVDQILKNGRINGDLARRREYSARVIQRFWGRFKEAQHLRRMKKAVLVISRLSSEFYYLNKDHGKLI